MSSQSTKVVNKREVSCDGGNGALGHPKIYLHIKPEIDEIICPYCGQHFAYKEANDAKKQQLSS